MHEINRSAGRVRESNRPNEGQLLRELAMHEMQVGAVNHSGFTELLIVELDEIVVLGALPLVDVDAGAGVAEELSLAREPEYRIGPIDGRQIVIDGVPLRTVDPITAPAERSGGGWELSTRQPIPYGVTVLLPSAANARSDAR